MTAAQTGTARIAEALRLGEAFHSWIRSADPRPWVWLPSIAQHWTAIVVAYSLRPWTGGSPDYRTHPDLAVQSWGAWLGAYAAELEQAGPVSSYLAQESDDATIARYTSAAFEHYGLNAGSWDLLRSYMVANQAAPPVVYPLEDDAPGHSGSHPNRDRWVAYSDGAGYPLDEHHYDTYPWSEHRADLGAWDDPQWDERQCWAAAAALVLAAHDLATPKLSLIRGSVAMMAQQKTAAHATAAPTAAPKSKLKQAVAIVGTTSLALVLVWILLA